MPESTPAAADAAAPETAAAPVARAELAPEPLPPAPAECANCRELRRLLALMRQRVDEVEREYVLLQQRVDAVVNARPQIEVMSDFDGVAARALKSAP